MRHSGTFAEQNPAEQSKGQEEGARDKKKKDWTRTDKGVQANTNEWVAKMGLKEGGRHPSLGPTPPPQQPWGVEVGAAPQITVPSGMLESLMMTTTPSRMTQPSSSVLKLSCGDAEGVGRVAAGWVVEREQQTVLASSTQALCGQPVTGLWQCRLEAGGAGARGTCLVSSHSTCGRRLGAAPRVGTDTRAPANNPRMPCRALAGHLAALRIHNYAKTCQCGCD